MMTQPRVLYDLALAAPDMGFSGIPQDTRLLFHGLLQSTNVSMTGLVRPHGRSYVERRSLDKLENQAVFLGHYIKKPGHQRTWIQHGLARLGKTAPEAWRLYMREARLTPSLSKMNPMLSDIVWRLLFAATVNSSGHDLICNQNYALSPIGGERNYDAGLGWVRPPKIATQDFDFLFTQDTKLFRSSRSTRKVSRYHDGIPISAADTYDSGRFVRLHARAIQKASSDTLFVCNSPSAQNDLRNISPAAGANSVVIPYFIPEMKRASAPIRSIRSIAENRISTATLAKDKHKAALDRWFDSTGDERLQYIMSLATIEPRKNYSRLIEAWQLLRMRRRSIRLMIVGSPGWDYEPIINRMKPHVEEGTLLHLEKVAQPELPFLYSRADVFVFPSVVEGFGLPPTEAMQCGCPTVISDIAAHRFMGGNAPIFCDPYNVKDIADKINLALDEESGLRDEVISKGKENVKRFTHDELIPLWETFFKDNMPKAARS